MGIKVRFDGLDVMAMVSHLNHVALGRRVINIYEGDASDAFLFKLDHNVNNAAALANTVSNTTQEAEGEHKEKLMLYLESGIRFHTTNRMQNNSSGGGGGANKNQPLAPFVFQLRKHLRGLRLEQVSQLGEGDRVVHFVFGMGEQRRALLLELYAKGNIVLCDAQYNIVTLLRSHQYAGEGGVQVQIGHVYPVTYAARNVKTHSDTLENESTNTKEESSVTASSSAQEWADWAEQQVRQAADSAAAKAAADEEGQTSNMNNNTANKNRKGGGAGGGGGRKKGKKDKQVGLTLKTLLLKPSSGISHYGPNFLEHCILLTKNFYEENVSTTTKLTPHTPLTVSDNNTSDNSAGANIPTNNLPSVSDWGQFLQVLRHESAKLDDDPKATAAAPPKGYILYSDKNATNGESQVEESSNGKNNAGADSFSDKVLEEFQPFLLLKQHEERKVMEFDTFNEAVDTFFGHLEAQKRLLRAEAAEQAAKDKLEKVRQDQQHRLHGLEVEVEKVQEQAQVVELNADNVEKALQVINSALDSGMDWEQLESLVHVEQEENQNPIALLIYQLDLDQDCMILELPTAQAAFGSDDNEDEDDQVGEPDDTSCSGKKKQTNKKGSHNGDANVPAKRKVKKNHVLVTVSLKETAHGNASELFARYRNMKEKSQRTVEASAKALKAAEETAQRQLADAKQRSKQATNTAVGQIIKPPWFTKFHWFITSENYLVLGGRDAHQNEVLVKKYLRPGDAYLHADVHGAASCILRAKRIRVPAKAKNKKEGATTTQTLPLSDQALREAGNFTICRSSAWASKMVTSAWWVESHQVSKTAPTGEFLKVGAFMIRGKKNFLPPTPLEMGLGVMFRLAAPEGTLDPVTFARHKNERRDFALMELLQQQEDGISESDDEENQEDSVDVAIEQGQLNNGAELSTANEVLSKAGVEKAFAVNETDENETDENDTKASAAEFLPMYNTVEEKDTHNTPKLSPEMKKKKGLSIKERKLIKKYGSLEEAGKILAERKKEQQGDAKEKEVLTQLAVDKDSDEEDTANNNQGTMKRGKRGKKKKVMKKYADQDEEDRELAMLALQGGEKIKKTKEKRVIDPSTDEQKQAAAETAALLVKNASEVAEKVPEDIRTVLAECVTVQSKEDDKPIVRWDKFDADVLEQLMAFEGSHEAKLAAAKRLLFLKSTTRIDNFSASLSGILRTIRKYGHVKLETETPKGTNDGPKRKTNEEKKAADAEWKETLAQEGIAGDAGDDEDFDIDDTAENNKLTGKPYPEDTLIYALPVCAPYQTLTQYTYRIKLTPGNLKRGKAARQCVDMFLRGDTGGGASKNSTTASTSDVGKDLIKKVVDNDWVQCLCADVKISAAGASKAVKKQKANIKAKAKKKK